MRTLFYCFVAVLALLLVVAEPVSAQLAGKITVVAVPDRFKAGNGNQATHGITNVGVGARVVLKPFLTTGVTNPDANAAHGVVANSAIWTVSRSGRFGCYDNDRHGCCRQQRDHRVFHPGRGRFLHREYDGHF